MQDISVLESRRSLENMIALVGIYGIELALLKVQQSSIICLLLIGSSVAPGICFIFSGTIGRKVAALFEIPWFLKLPLSYFTYYTERS